MTQAASYGWGRSFLLFVVAVILGAGPRALPCLDCGGDARYPLPHLTVEAVCSRCDYGGRLTVLETAGALLRWPAPQGTHHISLDEPGAGGQVLKALFDGTMRLKVSGSFWPYGSLTPRGVGLTLLALLGAGVALGVRVLRCPVCRSGVLSPCGHCEAKGTVTIAGRWLSPSARRAAVRGALVVVPLILLLVFLTTWPVLPCHRCPEFAARNRNTTCVVWVCDACDGVGRLPYLH